MQPESNFDRQFYFPFCSESEIDRILNVSNAKDELLKLRADTIADHMRPFRVMRARAINAEPNWSLESYFDDSHYLRVIDSLPLTESQLCSSVMFGDIFSTDPTGQIFLSDYGSILTISESLKYFLKFALLSLLKFEIDLPPHVRMNALRIAIRTMSMNESMDFFLDPRGIIPNSIEQTLEELVSDQLQFVAGHEFAHHLLGHLSPVNFINAPLVQTFYDNSNSSRHRNIYSTSQLEEFEADIQSILLPDYQEATQHRLMVGGLLFHGCLDLFEFARELLFPDATGDVSSHPSALDRYDNLLANMPESFKDVIGDWSPRALVDSLKLLIRRDITENRKIYEFYGSVYLDVPNTKWRGPALIDRKDF